MVYEEKQSQPCFVQDLLIQGGNLISEWFQDRFKIVSIVSTLDQVNQKHPVLGIGILNVDDLKGKFKAVAPVVFDVYLNFTRRNATFVAGQQLFLSVLYKQTIDTKSGKSSMVATDTIFLVSVFVILS